MIDVSWRGEERKRSNDNGFLKTNLILYDGHSPANYQHTISLYKCIRSSFKFITFYSLHKNIIQYNIPGANLASPGNTILGQNLIQETGYKSKSLRITRGWLESDIVVVCGHELYTSLAQETHQWWIAMSLLWRSWDAICTPRGLSFDIKSYWLF